MSTAPLKYCFFCAVFFIASSAEAGGNFDQIRSIEKLASSSADSKIKCDDFVQSIDSLDHSTRDYFSSKEISLQILKKVKSYPGTPLSTQKALSSLLYLDASDLPGGPLGGDLRTSLARLNDCRSVDFYAILIRLLASRKRYHFSQDENVALRTVIMNHLSREASGPRLLFQVRMTIRLLIQSTKEMLLFPTPDQRTKIDSLETLLDQSLSNEGTHLALLETDKSKVAAQANTNELNVNRAALLEMLWQMGESEKLRIPLADIVTRLAKTD